MQVGEWICKTLFAYLFAGTWHFTAQMSVHVCISWMLFFGMLFSKYSQSNQSRTSIVFLPPFASSGALNSLLYVFYNFCVLWWYSQPFKISTKTLIEYSWAGISKIVFIITWVTGLQTTISSLVLIQHSAKLHLGVLAQVLLRTDNSLRSLAGWWLTPIHLSQLQVRVLPMENLVLEGYCLWDINTYQCTQKFKLLHLKTHLKQFFPLFLPAEY